MKTFYRIATIILLCSASYNCIGQIHTDTKKSLEENTVDPSGTSNGVSFTNYINLKSTFGDGSAEAKIDFLKNDDVVLGLKLSTPVGKNDTETKTFTLSDGLAGSSSLELNFAITFWNPDPNRITNLADTYRQRNNIASNVPVRFSEIENDLSTNNNTADLEILKNAFGRLTYLSIKPGISRPEFTYVSDTTTFSLVDETKTNFNISVGLSEIPHWKLASMLGLSLTYQKKYKAPSLTNIYNIPAINNSFVQKEFFIGAPKLKDEFIISTECRTILSTQLKINIRPNINYLVNEKVGSVEIPIYYYGPRSAGDSFLNGGIYFGYKTDPNFKFETKQNNILLGIFISKELGRLL